MLCLTAEQDASAEGGDAFLQFDEIIHLDVLQRQYLLPPPTYLITRSESRRWFTLAFLTSFRW